jgi:type III restriction enzyme
MKLDSFRSRRPIDVIAAVNPILIIDEPQSVLGTDKNSNVTREKLGAFNPLFCINYSATHRETFNMTYRLDAVDAYQKQLVKKITVKGISILGNTATNGYLYLQKINVYPDRQPDADIVIEHVQKTSENIKKVVKRLRKNDNIYTCSGELEAYKNGFTITSIDARNGEVEFTNGSKLYAGECVGDVNEDELRSIQIRETIASHIEKEKELFKKGIKVLSLFFIDEVAKYKYYDEAGEQAGVYAALFETEYKMAVNHFLEQLPFEEDKKYRAYLEKSLNDKVHAGYFSVDKKGRLIDSAVKRGESYSDDTSAYDLIMKNKERLLAFEEPVRFIFSHSALREGWDNPNVFQICTLRTSNSEIKKRQEVGRGLRLAVDQYGERQDSETLGAHGVHDVNVLTVVANESYERFACALQDEFREVIKNRPKEITEKLFENAVAVDNIGNSITLTGRDASRIFVRLEDSGLVKDGQLTETYHTLGAKEKTEKVTEALDNIYAPVVDSIIKLIENVYDGNRQPLVSDARNKAVLFVDKEKYSSKQFIELWNRINTKSFYTVDFDENELIEKCIAALNRDMSVTKLAAKIETGSLKATNGDVTMVKGKISKSKALTITNSNVQYDLIGELATPTGLTRACIGKILYGIHKQRFDLFFANPEEFIRKAVKLIEGQMASTVIEHITYNKLTEQWNAEDIFVDNSISGEYGKNIADAKKHLYDKLRYDSDVEKKFANDMDIADVVELYIKLPRGFYIHTPMGKYNPDWAIALKEDHVKHIYFVAESKGSIEDLQLRKIEDAKIECARRHFETVGSGEIKYDVVDSFEKLMEKIKD